MEEIMTDNILDALRAVKRSNANDLHIQYDREADVMYVNFGAPIPADDSELDDNDVLYRYRQGEIVGMTFTHFSKR